ncbi:hypothetical protein D1641_06745 [Colidextribacter sp. OB.20]|uniref:hypothetical protein n=1 Tax=Colidextribacter sp. OB.20 TaxID=2304568 RepID=UPI00136EA534|nr:hypothetical protein [Colidextribacter sp. OB.20]NBI09713.1 hypothetical protein [Colidextribacter sp. OB.20]
MKQSHRKRPLALAMAVLMTAGCTLPASAASIGSGVSSTYDEAYYATLDYYGNLLEGSVVKSYALNGAAKITDYGTYDEVVNLTDSTPAKLGQGQTDFQFSQAPGHFYFEGKTAQPFQDLPWTITLRYSLNGVPARAEELAGQKGVVDIDLDLVPNRAASAYARYNYTLEAMAIFNEDDILSLDAPGAQVQLVGNLRSVLFMALPGEEQHFTIRVGSDDFSFNGMTILMVPATLSQLEEIAKLSQRKDELEEDYRALSGSLDALLDALNDIQDGLYASANGLDQLDKARGTISGGKGQLYDEAGVLRGDLSGIADLLEPAEQRIQILSQTIASSKLTLNEMTDTAVSLKHQLDGIEAALESLADGTGDVKQVVYGLADMKDSLRRLERSLDNSHISSGGSSDSSTPGTALVNQVKEVHRAYETARDGGRTAAFTALLMLQGESSSSASEKAAAAAPLAEALSAGATEEMIIASQTKKVIFEKVPGVTEDTYEAVLASPTGAAIQAQVAQTVRAQLPEVKKLDGLYQVAQSSSFQTFCENLPGVSKSQAKQMADLWTIYSNGGTPAAGGMMSGALAGSMLSGRLLLASAGISDTQDSTPGVVPRDTPSDSGSEPAPDSGSSPESDPDGSASPDSDSEPAPDSGDSAPDSDKSSVGSAAVDLIANGLDSANAKISAIQKELNNTLKRIATPTADVVGKLASLCDDIGELADLLDDAEDLAYALSQTSGKLSSILDSVDALRLTLNEYEPTLQEGLTSMGSLSTAAVTTLRDMETLLADTESLMRTSGVQLDAGTRQTLRGLASTLRQTGAALSTTQNVKNSKNALTGIIEDTWHEYTGDINNILLMDAEARAVSLTDPRNPIPSSVQVLIRTQEIKAEDGEASGLTAEPLSAKTADNGTFWSRVAQMFKDFWLFLTGIFR